MNRQINKQTDEWMNEQRDRYIDRMDGRMDETLSPKTFSKQFNQTGFPHSYTLVLSCPGMVMEESPAIPIRPPKIHDPLMADGYKGEIINEGGRLLFPSRPPDEDIYHSLFFVVPGRVMVVGRLVGLFSTQLKDPRFDYEEGQCDLW